jgi:hypothetical protein
MTPEGARPYYVGPRALPAMPRSAHEHVFLWFGYASALRQETVQQQRPCTACVRTVWRTSESSWSQVNDLLSVLLLDPRRNVQAPGVGHQKRTSNIPAVDRAAAENVQQVALRDTVEANNKCDGRGDTKDA